MKIRYILLFFTALTITAFGQNTHLSQLEVYLQKQKDHVVADSIRHIFAVVSKDASDSYRYEYHKDGADTMKYELAFRYDNDSVISRATGLSSTGVNQLRIPANGNHLVKEIRGFVYLTPEKEPTTTLKLMFIRGIQLIKFRKQEKPIMAPVDSANTINELKPLN